MIKQVQFSDSVKFFKEGFKDKWQLVDYSRISDPAIFVGIYSTLDIAKIKLHKGKKIVFVLGADIPNISRLIGVPDIIWASDKQNILDIYSRYNLTYINEIIPLKSFDIYRQLPKGNKIYCYINNSSEGNKSKHRIQHLEPAIQHFGKDKFIFGVHGHSSAWVRENWYRESFVNIQLNEMAGFTSAIEMAYMGRNSISNNAAPFCLNWKTPQDIIELIEQEQYTPLDSSVEGYLCNSNQWLKII
jgi:hypothetical protein